MSNTQFIESLANEIADELLGSCVGDVTSKLEEAVEEGKISAEDAKTFELDICLVVDEQTFCCVTCGWWCEAGDWYDNGYGEDECGQCHLERDEDG